MNIAKTQPNADNKIAHQINDNNKLLNLLVKQIVDLSAKKILIVAGEKIAYANPKVLGEIGLNSKSIKDKPIDSIIFPSRGTKPLSHYLGRSASLKNSNDEDSIVIVGRKGREFWYNPTVRRCFWDGRSAVLLTLNDIKKETQSDSLNSELLDRYQLGLKIANQYVWDYQLDPKTLYLSPDYFSHIGYQPQEITPSIDRWMEVLHPDSAKEFSLLIASLANDDDLPNLWEYRAKDKRNGYKWFACTWQIVGWSKTNKPNRIVGIHEDIDARKKQEYEHKSYQNTLYGFVNNSLDGLLIVDETGNVQEWNPVQEAISNIPKHDIIGHSLNEMLQVLNENTHAKLYINELNKVLLNVAHASEEKKKNSIFEVSVKLPNTYTKYYQHSVFTISTLKGSKIAASVKDITEKKINQLKLEKNEERLKLALAAGNVGIWDVDMITGETYYSPMTFTIFGYRPWEVSPTLESWKELIHPDDYDWVVEKANSFFMSGTNGEIELRIKKKDGSYIWIQSKNRILRDENNKTLRATGTIIDITSQKEIEQELRSNQEVLERNLKQHELISDISYLLNTNIDFAEKNDKVLSMLGEFSQVSRVYIFENNYKKGITRNTYEWCNKGVEPQIHNLQEFPLDIVGNWAGDSEYMVSWNLAADLPSDFAKLMIDQGIKSFLIFPLKISDQVFGYIGFDDCDHQRIWTKPEIDLLKTISNLISFSFEREQIKRHYKQNETSYKIISHVISDCIFEVSIAGRIEFINPYGLQKLGLTQKSIEKGVMVSDLISDSDYQELDRNIEQLIKGTDLNPQIISVRIDNEWVKAEVYAKPRRSENEVVGYSGVLIIKD